MNNVTVVILTLNESINIARCINSLPVGTSIVVVDSGSTDRTESLASELGALVLHRPFDSFGSQRNWAMNHKSIRTDWILFLDADEEATLPFLSQINDKIEGDTNGSLAGVYCCWKMMLRGRWLRRSDNFPKWQMRLVHRKKMLFTEIGRAHV